MRNWLTERNTILVRLFVAILFTGAPADSGGAGINDREVAIVYVTNWASNSISRFELSAGGSLALREVIPAPQESANALGAALSAGRRSLYVAQWGSGRFPSSRSSAMAGWRHLSLSPQRPRPPLTVLKWSSRRTIAVHT